MKLFTYVHSQPNNSWYRKKKGCYLNYSFQHYVRFVNKIDEKRYADNYF